jgi:hypothetical protein
MQRTYTGRRFPSFVRMKSSRLYVQDLVKERSCSSRCVGSTIATPTSIAAAIAAVPAPALSMPKEVPDALQF